MTRILVVDDLESHLYLAKSLLEPFGYEVVVCNSHADAMNALATQGAFDLILSDIGMPGSTGFDFIKQVKADPRFRTIPFVFITATYWAEADKVKGMELGATKFIFRPLEARAILTEIEDVLQPEKRLSKNKKS
ncbi:MAG TPA: response regulator [Candidatus Obscuribacterales bacterium]